MSPLTAKLLGPLLIRHCANLIFVGDRVSGSLLVQDLLFRDMGGYVFLECARSHRGTLGIPPRPHDITSMPCSPCILQQKSFAEMSSLSIADACVMSICRRNWNVTRKQTDRRISCSSVQTADTSWPKWVSSIEQMMHQMLLVGRFLIPCGAVTQKPRPRPQFKVCDRHGMHVPKYA